jgi:transglutaminase-like putative cysteine protease
MRKILTFIIFVIFFFVPRSVFAESNFITDYDVTYNVLENSLTHVTFDIALTNKTSQYYASSYGIQVGFKNVTNVLSSDSKGRIVPDVVKNNDGSNIEITFNDRVVGMDKKLYFSLSFDTANVVQKTGKIWDINIPGLKDQGTYNSFDVKVIVPKSLESPSYVKPNTGKIVNNNLVFTKDELGESGISIAFGKEQIYNFNLLYHLENTNLFPIKTEIAIPPSTNYQDIQISNIDPAPQNVIEDSDGNWLAQYVLKPSKKLDINVYGKAKVMLSPKKERQSNEDLKKYLKEQPYWQTSNKEIKDLALKLKTPYAIFQYVVEHLKYDFSRVQNNKSRIGALETLRNPTSAVCLEFTDLFIALARSAGIPAREINGFAFTQNSKERPLSLVKDILHAWPEYYDYDLQTWVMIDPTWGNTTGGVDYFYTLDFDHFAFAIKGIDSSYPVPAGGYKISKNNTKDIDIKFGNDFSDEMQILSLSENFEKIFFSGISPKGNILVKNDGHIVSLPQEITITTNILKPLSQKIALGKIPPFGYVEIPVGFKKPSLLTNKTDEIRISINKNYISKDIKITPFVLNKWTILGGSILVIISITIFIIIYKARSVSFSKQKESDIIRRQGEKP